MKKILYLIGIFATVLIISGCQQEAEAGADKYHDPLEAPLLLPETPIGVTEGAVTKEYFDELNIFYSRMSVYTMSQYLFRTEPQVDETVLQVDEYFANYEDLLDKADGIMEDFSVSPTTPAEEEIHKALKEYKKSAKETSNMLREFLAERNLSIVRANLDLVDVEAQKEKTFYETMKKYKLNTRE